MLCTNTFDVNSLLVTVGYLLLEHCTYHKSSNNPKSARTRKILEGSIESPEKAIHKKIRQFNKMIVKLLTPAIAITASSYLAIFIRKLNKPIGIAMQEKLGIIKSFADSELYANINGFIASNQQIIEIISKISYSILCITTISLLSEVLMKEFEGKKILELRRMPIAKYGVITILATILVTTIWIFDLKENYGTDTSRFIGLFNLAELHGRTYPYQGITDHIDNLINENKNIMFMGYQGYVGKAILVLSAFGTLLAGRIEIKTREQAITKIFCLSCVGVYLISTFLIILPLPISTVPFFLLSLVNPLAFLQNNISMYIYQIDILLLPLMALAIKWITFTLPKLITKKNWGLFPIQNNRFSEFTEIISASLFSLLVLFIELPKLHANMQLTLWTLDRTHNFTSSGKSDSAEAVNIESQNPKLNKLPLYVSNPDKDSDWTGLPTYPRSHRPYKIPNFEIKSTFGTRQEHYGSYYSTMQLKRFSEEPILYEIRHKKLIMAGTVIDPKLRYIINPVKANNDVVDIDTETNDDISDKQTWTNNLILLSYKDAIKSSHECSNYEQCMHFNSIRIAITKAELNQYAQELDRESMITLELPTHLRNYATSIFSPERSSIKLIKLEPTRVYTFPREATNKTEF